MTPSATLHPRWQRLQRRALLVGLVAAGLCVLGYFAHPAQFFRSYLMAYMFWLGVVLGCLAILMLHHLVGGRWGVVLRRGLEAATRLLPLMLVLYIPLIFGLSELYVWAPGATVSAQGRQALGVTASTQREALPGGVAAPGLSALQQVYLRVPFFLGRAGVYFVVWLGLAFFLNRWSRQQEQEPDPLVIRTRQRRLGMVSGGGLVLYGLTMTFAAVDWLMSLEPQWFSTVYGFLVLTGQLLVAMAFAILVTFWLAQDEPYAAVASPELWRDLGNLLLAGVMLWAYMAFAQLLIIWSGDLPEEIRWYLHRAHGGWNWVGVGLVGLHFAVPFCLLLSRRVTRWAPALATVAAVLCGLHLVDVFWLVMPAFFPGRLRVHWLDIVAPIAVGGLWLAAFLWQLQRRSLLPWYEPSLQEAMPHG
jgi:hypothetical protein